MPVTNGRHHCGQVVKKKPKTYCTEDVTHTARPGGAEPVFLCANHAYAGTAIARTAQPIHSSFKV